MPLNSLNTFFKVLKRIEHLAAYAQGKGYSGATMEQEVKLLQSSLKRQPSLAIDVGGNVGNYAAELRKRNPTLEIHVFEPAAANVDKLKSRFKDDEMVKVVPVALSDEVGAAALFANEPGSGMASLTKRKLDHLSISFESQEMVNTIRFEEYWRQELQSRRLDMVKVDVEGHELSVLKGFGSALAATEVVQFEFGGTDIDTRTFFRDFWYFFHDAGFRIFRFTPFGLQPITRYSEGDECFDFTNFLAVNQSNG